MRRIFVILLTAATIWMTAGCSAPSGPLPENTQASQDPAQELVRALEARNKGLADRLSPESRSVDLISPDFPPAVGGQPGWKYHKTLTADLDADGEKERVSVTTNAEWIPEQKEFAWDDGHPWHVYVEEADGGRTYLFSNWVQMGRLDAILDREGPGLFIVSSRGGELVIYRATYRGPGEATTVLAFDIPLSDFAMWTDPLMFSW